MSGVGARELEVQKLGRHLGFLSSSPLVSCCDWKAGQEGGGAGETKSQFAGQSTVERGNLKRVSGGS